MRVLAFDPGAERCGWAVLDDGPRYVASGIIATPRNGMAFQQYRIGLEMHVFDEVEALIARHEPHVVVNETIPAVGGGNFVVATQSYLANCVVATIHICAFTRRLPIKQISARTVQSKVAAKGKGKKITKVRVRNGVVAQLPELKPRVPEWVKIFDEVDAIANGLAYLID